MKNGSKIEIVDKCKHLGTSLYSDVKRKHTPDVVRYLIGSLNKLLLQAFVWKSTFKI